MKTATLQQSQTSNEQINYQSILLNWLAAVQQFYAAYQQANACLHRHRASKKHSYYIGQCPVDELVKSMDSMRKQLEDLLGQMDQASIEPQNGLSWNWNHLASHTQVLAQLTQLIQLRLSLAQQPAA